VDIPYGPPTMSGGATARETAVVLGGSVAGLATARLLGRHFARVVVLERDVRADVTDPEDAFATWERPAVPQFRHSHAFLARLRLILLAHMPEVLDRLRACGVREIQLVETVPPGMRWTRRADDEDVVLLACRRATFEWALRESVRAIPNVEIREGAVVTGLVGTRRDGGRPCVTGVRLDDDTELAATLVVDATGRRSRASDWLAALGAPRPREHVADTGILYYTRFYRLLRGTPPVGGTGLVAVDLGWVKLAIFPGDRGTFSITVGPPVDDEWLKRLSDPEQFERFVTAFPAIAPWRAHGVSTPIFGPTTSVLVMGQLRNRIRRFVDRDGPLATGFVGVGDVVYHSNPIYGRGCPSALMMAELLDEALGRHRGDAIAMARDYDAACRVHVQPFWEAAAASDRRMLGQDRTPPSSNRAALIHLAEQAFGWFIDRGMVPATRVDPVVFRGLLRVFHMLDTPEELVRNPEILLRSVPVLARVLRGDEPAQQFPPTSRDRILEKLG
jgi:2-polyprenyl-6-methoxyphenol hydroxylase-like FAD-dependent oxidoreductase